MHLFAELFHHHLSLIIGKNTVGSQPSTCLMYSYILLVGPFSNSVVAFMNPTVCWFMLASK